MDNPAINLTRIRALLDEAIGQSLSNAHVNYTFTANYDPTKNLWEIRTTFDNAIPAYVYIDWYNPDKDELL